MRGSLPKDHRAITTPAGGDRRDATHGSAQNRAIGAGRSAKDARDRDLVAGSSHQDFFTSRREILRARVLPSIESVAYVWPSFCSVENVREDTRLTLRIYRPSTPRWIAAARALRGQDEREP